MTRLIRSAAVLVAVFVPGLAAAQQLPLPREPGAYQAPPLYDEMGRPNLPQMGGGAAAPPPSHWNAMGRNAQFRAGMQRYGTDGRRAYSPTHSLGNLPPAAPARRAAPVRPGAPPRAPWETR